MTIPNTFADRTVLVSGAGGGVGQSVAEAFARPGTQVVLVGRSISSLESTADRVEALGGRATPISVDVTDGDAVAATLGRMDRLDVAVNAAGIVHTAPVADMHDREFTEILNVNVRGLWLSLKYEIRAMRRSGGGSIVNIGSNVGPRVTRTSLGAYAASKAAVSAMTKTAALEELTHAIRINCLCPGPIDTPLSYRPGEDRSARDARLRTTNPSGRVATTGEIAAATVWLASSEASYIVGQEIVMDGGASI